nr:hypothetical protein [Tanacetum cinerariifolium]
MPHRIGVRSVGSVSDWEGIWCGRGAGQVVMWRRYTVTLGEKAGK